GKGSSLNGLDRSLMRPWVSFGPCNCPRLSSQRTCNFTAACPSPGGPPHPCHCSANSLGSAILLLSSSTTDSKRWSKASGTSWLASTTTLVISSSTACKNWAQGLVKRL